MPGQAGNTYVIIGKILDQPMVNIFKPWDVRLEKALP
jgi:hypothetical protein